MSENEDIRTVEPLSGLGDIRNTQITCEEDLGEDDMRPRGRAHAGEKNLKEREEGVHRVL